MLLTQDLFKNTHWALVLQSYWDVFYMTLFTCREETNCTHLSLPLLHNAPQIMQMFLVSILDSLCSIIV